MKFCSKSNVPGYNYAMVSKVIDAMRDLLDDVFGEAPRNGIRYLVLSDNDGSIQGRLSSLEYLDRRNLLIVQKMLRNEDCYVTILIKNCYVMSLLRYNRETLRDYSNL